MNESFFIFFYFFVLWQLFQQLKKTICSQYGIRFIIIKRFSFLFR